MSRYDNKPTGDDPIIEEGDSHFVGFDTRLHPTLLKEGIAQRSENMRFDDFTATVRKGVDRITDDVLTVGNPLILPFQLGGSIPIASITRIDDTAYVTLANITSPEIADGEEMEVEGATQTEYNSATHTSGALIEGRMYYIADYGAGDFTAIGAASNANGVIFTATGTTPTPTWSGDTVTTYTIWSRVLPFDGLHFSFPVFGSPTTPATAEVLTGQVGETLDIGVEYTITTYYASDDFSNIGGPGVGINGAHDGTVFTVTGDPDDDYQSIPTVWATNSVLTRSNITTSGLIGLVLDGVFATCLFSDVDTNKDYIAMATNLKAILVDPDNVGTTIEIPYGGSETLNAADLSDISQVNNGLVIHRGKLEKALEWDGNIDATLPVTITGITRVTTTATVTTFLDHGYQTGDIVTIAGAVETDYNGDQTITLLTATTFSYVMGADPGGSATTLTSLTGELSPQFAVIADTGLDGYLSMPKAEFSVYHPFARLIVPVRVLELDVTGITSSGGTATATTGTAAGTGIAHGLRVGDRVEISGASEVIFNGLKLITSIGDPNASPIGEYGYFFEFAYTGTPGTEVGSAIKAKVDVRDQFIVSDIYDHKTYDPVNNLFRVNRGSADFVVNFLTYQADNVIILCRRSIHVLSAITSSSLEDSNVTQITEEVGCVARKTALIVGDNMIFLSDHGVYMLGITTELNMRGRDVPLSFDIQDEFRALNYDYIDKAVAVYFNNRYYIAVPSLFQSDGTTPNTRNNIVFVYNFLNKKWESKDTFTGSANYIDNWVVCQKAGQDRLFASSVEGALQLWEENEDDEIPTEVGGSFVATEIDGRLTTRRYIGSGSHDIKRFNRGSINFEVGTSDAFTVTATSENPESSVTALTEVATADEDKHKRFRINKRGTGLELDINTTVGRPQIKSVSVGSTETQRSNKTFE